MRIAVWISTACAVLVLCLLAAAAFYLFTQAGPAGLDPAETDAVYAYLDTNDLLKAMVIAGVAGIAVAGVIGWVSARHAIRPLGEALEMQRRFVQDASHEMRTPLAVLDARIQLAQRQVTPGSPTGQSLARIRADTAALTTIVNDLLEAAAGAPAHVEKETSDVATVTAETIHNLRHVADQHQITVKYASTGELWAAIAPKNLRRAVLALTENALAHTPPGGIVTIATASDGDQAVIKVEDTGPGITGVDPDRIFDRFVHTTSTPRPGQRSYGIGLSLARELITRADGTLEVAATGPEGTVMRLTVPLQPRGNPQLREGSADRSSARTRSRHLAGRRPTTPEETKRNMSQ